MASDPGRSPSALGRNPSTGKHDQRTYTIRGTKRDAERFRTELLHQIDTGTLVDGKRVTLAPDSFRVLRQHHASQAATMLALGLRLGDDGLVFCRHDGEPLLPNSVSHALGKISVRAGLQEVAAVRFDAALANEPRPAAVGATATTGWQ